MVGRSILASLRCQAAWTITTICDDQCSYRYQKSFERTGGYKSEISSAEWRAYAQDSERGIQHATRTVSATLESQLAEARRDSERLDAVEQNSWTVARWRKTEYCTGGNTQ